MYLYNRPSSTFGTRLKAQWPGGPRIQGLGMPAAELKKKLKFLSLLPHSVQTNGTNVALTPAAVDPKIYDGLEKYLVAKPLQDCLNAVMKKNEFKGISAALVDLTKGVSQPEFAGFNHKSQVFAASVPKIVTLLAAFQLRHDLRVALNKKTPKPTTLANLFDDVRDDWANTQHKGTAAAFTRGVSLSGKLVVAGRSFVALGGPTIPELERVFADVAAGTPLTVEFRSTGENTAALRTIVDDYNLKVEKQEIKAAKQELKSATTVATRKAGQKRLTEAIRKHDAAKTTKHAPAKLKIQALGFLERLGIAVGGAVPASNLATSLIIRDIGFPYVISTLLQTGLYDTNRSGGLWLGADYVASNWRGPLAGGPPQSATAGSVAAFYTLLAQNALVSSQASTEMRAFLQKAPHRRFPGTGSWFKQGLERLKDNGSIKTLLAKVGLSGGADDCALIEREVDAGGGKKVLLRYVAVALRARDGKVLRQIIREFDKCILLNNKLTPEQGGHST